MRFQRGVSAISNIVVNKTCALGPQIWKASFFRNNRFINNFASQKSKRIDFK